VNVLRRHRSDLAILGLFVLLTFLIKTIRHRTRRVPHAALALLFLWVTGLASWHLFAFALLLTATYVIYSLIAERDLWDWKLVAVLAGMGLGCALLLAPLAYPIIFEQLSTDTPYLAFPVEVAEGNDLLSFVLPSPYHPLFGRLTAPVHERFKLAGRRPAYLGFVAAGLAILAMRTQKRATLYWKLTGAVFLVLSIGPYVKVYGQRLRLFRTLDDHRGQQQPVRYGLCRFRHRQPFVGGE
jgi:hypothetical protein